MSLYRISYYQLRKVVQLFTPCRDSPLRWSGQPDPDARSQV